MEDINKLVRQEVCDLQGFCPQLPDRTIDELKTILGREDVIKLSFNESPYGPSPQAIAAIIRAARYAHLYHDAEGKKLRAAIGKQYGFDEQQVFMANGADEIITLLAQAFLAPGDEVVMPTPTFGAYAVAAKLMGAQPVSVPVNQDMAIDFSGLSRKINTKTKMIFICNPNNPTGTLAEGAALTEFLRDLPDSIMVVLDEAYGEYVTSSDFVSGTELLTAMPNVITVRTFSKIYGLAGLRLGYGIASSQVVDVINRVRSPFNVNMLVQEAALAAIEDQGFKDKIIALNASERDKLTDGLKKLGFTVYASQTNFVFADSGMDSEKLCAALAQQGIIIRPAKGWDLPTYVRISIGNGEQNQELLKQLHNMCLK